jgi:chromosome segregation ATPase
VIRALYILNLLGIVALVALCVAQWHRSSRDDRLIQSLEQARVEQGARLDKQAVQLVGSAGGLEELRHRLTDSQAELSEAHSRLDARTADLIHLRAECQQLQATLRQWAAAIATRDQALQKASGDIQELTVARDQAVAKFNQVVARYNALVAENNRPTTQPVAATAPVGP